MTEQRVKEILARMDAMVAELIEHGDCALVLFTYMDEDQKGRFSRLLSKGRGNHYTREGIAFDYLVQMASGNCADQEPPEESRNDEEGYQP